MDYYTKEERFFYDKQLYYQHQEVVRRDTKCRVKGKSASLREH